MGDVWDQVLAAILTTLASVLSSVLLVLIWKAAAWVQAQTKSVEVRTATTRIAESAEVVVKAVNQRLADDMRDRHGKIPADQVGHLQRVALDHLRAELGPAFLDAAAQQLKLSRPALEDLLVRRLEAAVVDSKPPTPPTTHPALTADLTVPGEPAP
jgi:hypothetical protein